MNIGEFLAILAPLIVTLVSTATWAIKKVLAILENQLDRANNNLEKMGEKYGELAEEIKHSNSLQKEAIKRLDTHISDTKCHIKPAEREALKELRG